MNKRFTWLAVLVFGALMLSCGTTNNAQENSSEEAETSEKNRQPAPDFTLKNSEDQQIQLSDYEGNVVLLNFWATWCGPCKIEMPWFVDFQRKYKDQGFSVIAVSMDEQGWEVVKPFIEEMKLNFPVVLGNEEVADKFGGVAALPTTFIIDKQGRIATSHQGLMSKSDYEDEIKRLL